MGNPNAEKGAKWERDVRDFLRVWFGRSQVTRPRQEGFGDVGDIHASPFIIQAKDVTGASLGTWLDAAKAQAVRAGELYGVVAWKRRRASTGAGMVTLDLRDFREILWRLRRAESLLEETSWHRDDGDPFEVYARELEEMRKR